MPTNPSAPDATASVDRLTLGVDSPRGTQPALHLSPCACFEAESSALLCEGQWQNTCFEAEVSAQYCTPCCSCLETE